MLGGNVAVKLGTRNQSAAADGDESDPPVRGFALEGAHGHPEFGGGFGEEEEAHLMGSPFAIAAITLSSEDDCGSCNG